MPNKVEKFPGSWVSMLPWADIADGDAWEITEVEISEGGSSIESVRVAAHNYAGENGFKFKTKVVGGSLFIQKK